MWQLARGLSVLPWQLWKPEKGEPTPPPAPDISTVLGPMLVTVTVWLGELVPIGTEPKSRLVGVIRNCWTPPAPRVVVVNFPFLPPPAGVLVAPAAVGGEQ